MSRYLFDQPRNRRLPANCVASRTPGPTVSAGPATANPCIAAQSCIRLFVTERDCNTAGRKHENCLHIAYERNESRLKRQPEQVATQARQTEKLSKEVVGSSPHPIRPPNRAATATA